MDYNLAKIYEAMLQGKEIEDSSIRSLSQIYEASLNSKPAPSAPTSAPTVPSAPTSAPTVPSAPISAPTAVSGNYQNKEYNDIIIRELRSLIPPNKVYGLETGTVNLDKPDYDNFIKLYSSKGANDTSTGKGEIALYWLFGKANKVNNNQGGLNGIGEKSLDAPDLMFNDSQLVEIKSYPSLKDAVLGKFKKDKENRNLLSILLGTHILASVTKKDFSDKERPVTVDVFNPQEIQTAFANFITLQNFFATASPNTLNAIRINFSFIKTMEDQIHFLCDSIYPKIGVGENAKSTYNPQKPVPNDPKNMCELLLKKFAMTKLEKKPGNGGLIINVSTKPSRTVEIVKVDFSKTKKGFDYSKNVSATSGELKISNLNELFP